MILKIGVFYTGAATDKTTCLKLIACAQSCPRKQPSCADVGFAQKIVVLENGHWLQTFHLHIDFNVILQILPDAR